MLSMLARLAREKNGDGILYRLMEHKRNHEKILVGSSSVTTFQQLLRGLPRSVILRTVFVRWQTPPRGIREKMAMSLQLGNVTEEKESELEEFIDYAKLLWAPWVTSF